MKICILTHTFPRFHGDPSAPFMGNLAEALANIEGNQITILAPFDSKIKLGEKRPYKIKIFRYIYPDKFHILGYSRTLQGDKALKLSTYILSPFLYFFEFIALLKLVRKEHIDIISAHWIIPNGFIAALVSKIAGVPFTVTIPGSDIYLGSKNSFFKALVGFAAKNANTIISDSSHYLKQLNDLGFFPSKTEVIRYGVDIEKFAPSKKNQQILGQFNLHENTPIILAVGRLVEKKGFIYLIKAMPTVLKTVEDAKLVIVGEGGQKDELQKEVRKLQIEDRVIFAGTISYDQLAKYYNLGDVFVMPSVKDEKGNIDASPVAMMEAMACGTPVVATNFAGNDNLIKSGESGYLVKEKNSQEIADSIISLIKRKNEKAEIRKKVREIAKNNFSIVVIAKKYMNIFKNIKFDFSQK